MSSNEANRVLTVRNVPVDVDEAISIQAKAQGRSKSELVQELLTATFSDPIGNFCRTSGLVALMDQDVAKTTGASLSDYWFDAAHTLAGNRAYCRILSVHTEDELQHILKSGIPHLGVRVKHLHDVTVLPNGISLIFALFIEAATRDLETMLKLQRALYFDITQTQFFDQIDEVRLALRLPPIDRPRS